MKHEIPVWQMVRRALRAHGGRATNIQLRDWILQRWPDVPKGTINCQRIICTVNQPSRTDFPENFRPRLANSRYDFMFKPAPGLVERYSPKKHGRWEIAQIGPKLVARLVPAGTMPVRTSRQRPASPRPTLQHWILVHSAAEFNDQASYQSPAQELLEEFSPGILWNWHLPQPMRPDARRRLVLLGWNGAVIGDAEASITRRTGRTGSNFAFVLYRYRLLARPLPYKKLRLGDRASNHRSLIKLTADSLREYLRLRRLQPEDKLLTETISLSEADHGQGFGLTSGQRLAVAKHGMDLAKQELTRRGFDHVDVSHNRSFDLSAKAAGRHYFVEVKATTGNGRSVFLTANEVELHGREYPDNILVLVHSIKLTASGKASGGQIHFEQGWRLVKSRLKPVTYRYVRPQ